MSRTKRIKIPMPRGVVAYVVDRGDHVELANLIVHPTLRSCGRGTQAVRNIQKLGRRIRLEAVPFDGCKRKLHRFYKRLGFARLPKGRRTFFEWRPEV